MFYSCEQSVFSYSKEKVVKLRILTLILFTVTPSYLFAMDQKKKAEVVAPKAKVLKRSASAPSILRLQNAIKVWLHFSTKAHSLQSNWLEVTTPEDMRFNEFKQRVAQYWQVDDQKLVLIASLGAQYPQNSELSLSQLGIFSGAKILAFK